MEEKIKIKYPFGATPLSSEELEELLVPAITQDDLNKYEQSSILESLKWARKSRKLKKELMTINGILILHEKMFLGVWGWAGKFRKTDKNIGVSWYQISENLNSLCSDVEYWIENSVFSLDEIAIRWHHRLVQIHPFVNGNGRFARLSADIFLEFNRQKSLTWGSVSLSDNNSIRRGYIEALKLADKADYSSLIKFAKM